ncbi:hypothetical protein LDG_8169 [Legionella drancourtii LLAP12]|uniref:Uncharacterized protein n=1 Tax=Legionella drancourtii LLAP12 TaxID=658187 RepID=G9ES96_9GAMM|nr:hypothetical protein LDG_8169 [Legionella drancourtii LLAP12]
MAEDQYDTVVDPCSPFGFPGQRLLELRLKLVGLAESYRL